MLAETRARWRWLLDNLDSPLTAIAADAPEPYRAAIENALREERQRTLFHLLQEYVIRVSWKAELCAQLCDIFDAVGPPHTAWRGGACVV